MDGVGLRAGPIRMPPLDEGRALQCDLFPRRRPGSNAGGKPISVRTEKLLEKLVVHGLTRAKRCIVPASAFYEWRKVDGRKPLLCLTIDDEILWQRREAAPRRT